MERGSREQAFLEELAENPRDRDTRVVYADWLEEQGKAECAEFLRLWLEVGVGTVSETRLASMHQRLAELRPLFEVNWLDVVEPLCLLGEFSPRVRSCLRHLRSANVGSLLEQTENDILAAKGFGETALRELNGKLKAVGLCLRGENS